MSRTGRNRTYVAPVNTKPKAKPSRTGKSELSADSAEVNHRPSEPYDIQTILNAPRYVTLRWKPPLHSKSEVVGYSVYYQEQDSSRYVLI